MRSEPSFSSEMRGLDLRNSVAGATPTPRMTRSAGREVPSLRATEPTFEGSEDDGLALSTEADMWNFTPFLVRLD